MRARTPALALLAATALAACGGDDGDTTSTTPSTTAAAAATTAAPATTAAVTTTRAATATTAAPATTAAATATTAAATATTAAATGAATKVDVTVQDRSIVLASTTLKAGAIDFVVKNGGNSAHELVVIKGESYAALPKESNGAVTESALPAGSLLGRTGRIQGGGSETKSFTLTAGKYVLVCNITNGPTSHAGNGQRIDVTVA